VTVLNVLGSSSNFVTDTIILYTHVVPSVFSLPQRKGDFLNLFKNLTEIYLLSTDEQVLTNTARSIKFLSEGDHARSNEAKAGVKKLVSTISDRIVKHLSEKEDETNDTGRFKASRRKSPRRTLDSMIDSEDEGTHDGCSKQVDNETALYLNLRRARMLANFDIFSVYLDSCGESTEELCKLISKGLAQRLDSYKINLSSDTTDDPEKERWITSEDMLPRLTAGTVDEGLQLILATILQKLCAAIDEENLAVEDDNAIIDGIDDINEDDDDIDHHPVLTLRDCLISLVVQCYEQFLPSTDDPDTYTATQQLWADRVQQSGGEIAADLRSMFPKEWSDATSPLLRAFAIVDDSCLIGGYVRFIKSKEAERVS
jgi:cohesin complex subunit SA-1/2